MKTKKSARQLMEEAKEATSTPVATTRFAKFEQWPGTTEEMQEMVRAFEDEAHAIMCPSGMVLDDYKRLKEERDALERAVAEEGAVLDESLGEISATRDRWLPKLRELVATIDENFKNNFASIGCAGEIKLREDGENFGTGGWRFGSSSASPTCTSSTRTASRAASERQPRCSTSSPSRSSPARPSASWTRSTRAWTRGTSGRSSSA